MKTRKALLIIALATGSGCAGADIDAYCEARTACYGGNEQDQEACVVAMEAVEEIDSDVGCSDEHAAYFDCVNGAASCRDQQDGQSCDSSGDCSFDNNPRYRCVNNECIVKQFDIEGDTCEIERNAYNNCSLNLDLD